MRNAKNENFAFRISNFAFPFPSTLKFPADAVSLHAMPSETYAGWFSPRMGREMEILAWGDAGTPVLVFPSSWGRFYEWKDFLMIDALAGKIDAGHIQLYGVDSFCSESWYNNNIHPAERVRRHNAWESYVREEVIPFVRSRNSTPHLITAGVSFGAYLAVNFAFKHPEIVTKTVGLSGSYSIKRLLDGYYDDDCYFNCPVSYMANISDERLLGLMRRMEISLATSDWDIGICRERTFDMSHVLSQRGIDHRLDDWGGHTVHDWPSWRKMIGEYL
ncbi:MAG TPA: alpha/beta hydrolase-fold protein [Blastocatellia bacterium]|jgi:esterase/lipase superfamily enzyme|nr:alpha/beta hydrolase-fold protein [Blastocatellia bacterium]